MTKRNTVFNSTGNIIRSLAKNCKRISYSTAVVISFLMLGVNGFSQEDDKIKQLTLSINESYKNMRDKIEILSQKNKIAIANVDKEMADLLEQGEQVIKPWDSTWDYGGNYYYTRWKSNYRGKGDRDKFYSYDGVFKRDRNLFAKVTSPVSPRYSILIDNKNRSSSTSKLDYGVVGLKEYYEPIRTIVRYVTINPKSVSEVRVIPPQVDIKEPVLPVLNIETPHIAQVVLPKLEPKDRKVNIVKPEAAPFTDFYFNGVQSTLGPSYYGEESYYQSIRPVDRYTDGPKKGDLLPTYWSDEVIDFHETVMFSGMKPNGWQELDENDDIPTDKRAAENGGVNLWNGGKRVPIKINKDLDKNHNITDRIPPIRTGRPTNIIYRGLFEMGSVLKNGTFHIRGYMEDQQGKDGYIDFGSARSGGSSEDKEPVLGTVGIHVARSSHSKLGAYLENMKSYLYGRAALLSAETWQFSQVRAKDVKIIMYGRDNTSYYSMPSTYTIFNQYIGKNSHIGAFYGNTDILIYGSNNNIYLTTGISAPKVIENTGKIEAVGSSNIIYSSYSYLPNWTNTAYGEFSGNTPPNKKYGKMNSFIKIDNANLYGDEDKVLFFGDKMPGKIPHLHTEGSRTAIKELDTNYIKGSFRGIYQGEMDITAIIGEKVSLDGNEVQDKRGQLETFPDYTSETVDGAVGILAISGQRKGIIPTKHLGIPYDIIPKLKSFDEDKIHSLEIGKLDIRFGKYAKDGIMIASQRGTVIDVGYTSTHDYLSEVSKSITDGLNGSDTTFENTATGTIIAYSEGIWKQEEHQLGAKPISARSDTPITPSGLDELEGLPSEINIHIPVVMTSKNGIAYMGDNKGIVNSLPNSNNFDTEAIQYNSIIGYARKGGKVNINGNIKAVIGKDGEYSNIGGYANSHGEVEPTVVTIKGKADIKGIGAMSVGHGAKVVLESNENSIFSGKNGSLLALDGGEIQFGGGNIEHGFGIDDNSTTPFYSENQGKITFENKTTINMARGVVFAAAENAYSSEDGSIYNGMKNVDINLVKDGVTLAVFKEDDRHWNDNTHLVPEIKDKMKINSLNVNDKDYRIYFIDGKFTFDKNINLSNSEDMKELKYVVLSNEKVVVPEHIKISGENGKGLTLSSYEGVVSNSTNGFINKGEIEILSNPSGEDATALSVNFGTITNDNIIKVNRGIGVYGINGSSISNTGEIVISEKGYGIAAFSSSQSAQTLDESKKYGTDKKLAKNIELDRDEKVFRIQNTGNINISGEGSIGIYGNTNQIAGYTKLKNSDAIIENSGKINILSDKSYGIVSDGSGTTINLSGEGTEDIVQDGKESIGVFAKNSVVNINSDLGIILKDKGIGLFLDSGSTLLGNHNLNIKYTGQDQEKAIAIYYDGKNNTNFVNNMNIGFTTDVSRNFTGVGIYVGNRYGEKSNLINTGNIGLERGYGIVVNNGNAENTGNINILKKLGKEYSIGIYAPKGEITNSNNRITMGDKGIALYGNGISSTGNITVGEKGIGVVSKNGNVQVDRSTIEIGKNGGIGILTTGENQHISFGNLATLNIQDNSFGIVNNGNKNIIESRSSSIENLGNGTVFIYSNDKNGRVINNTKLVTSGNSNYGIYSSGNVENRADIDFSNGYGNIAIYMDENGSGINFGKINVGKTEDIAIPNSTKTMTLFGIGMAAGVYSDTEPSKNDTGHIINKGQIYVLGENSIGMYGTTKGSQVENDGDILLAANGTTGMYVDNGAEGINRGTIKTIGTGLRDVVGVVVKNGAIFTNSETGKIVLDAESAVGIISKGDLIGKNPGIIKNYGQLEIKGNDSVEVETSGEGTDAAKIAGDIELKVTPENEISIKVDNKIVEPTLVDTNKSLFKEIDISTIGMYVDTSALRFTKPIKGLSELKRLRKADLIIGAEAAEGTNSKYIQISKNIIEPYNQTIEDNPKIEKWNIYSGSLTWMADASQNKDTGLLEKVYMAKVPYVTFAGDKNSYNILDGMEQRYGVEGVGTREKLLFNKLSSIGNNEEILFKQAVDEMAGHQYGNIQHRIYSNGKALNREFEYLQDKWRNPTKNVNKIKTFGVRDEYKTNTAGIYNYISRGYGVAYVHEDESVKLGKKYGWYTGILHNTYEFKDIGHSREKALYGRVGVFKTIPFDNNNKLNLKLSGDIFTAYNKMKRNYLVVDEIFNARGHYWNYGLGMEGKLSRKYRLSEGVSLTSHISMKNEYGRFSKIKEKNGQMRLNIKANDYISVVPEVGMSIEYDKFKDNKNFKFGMGIAYYREVGNIDTHKNKAKVAYTKADWYDLPHEKSDKNGGIKMDINMSYDNSKYGITTSLGYDTKGRQVTAGVGVKVQF